MATPATAETRLNIGDRFNPSEKFDGIFIVNPILKYKGLSPGAKLVWGRLYRFSGKKGLIYPRVSLVADDIGLSIKQARRYLHELVEAKFMEIDPDAGHSNNYHFIWHSAYEGDVGVARIPLPDAGVPEDTPLPDAGVPTPPVSGSTLLPDAGDIREDLRVEYLREENTNSLSLKDQSQNLPTTTEACTVTEELNPCSAAPDAENFDSQSTFPELQLDVDICKFVKRVYGRRTGRNIDTTGTYIKGNIATKSHRVRQRLEEAERKYSAIEFRMALCCYLDEETDNLRDTAWPLNFFLKDPMMYLPEIPRWPSGAPATLSPRPAPASVSSETCVSAPTAFLPSEKSPLTYVDTWNTIVYDLPVDVDMLPSFTMAALKKAARDVDFEKCFELVCQKCQRMKANGQPQTFDGLFMGFKPMWQEIYAGKHDWKMGKPDPAADLAAKWAQE